MTVSKLNSLLLPLLVSILLATASKLKVGRNIDSLFYTAFYPLTFPGHALEKIETYAKIGDCYFVKFLLGHLEKELLVVIKMQAILPNGTLGKDLGEAKLPLWGE